MTAFATANTNTSATAAIVKVIYYVIAPNLKNSENGKSNKIPLKSLHSTVLPVIMKGIYYVTALIFKTFEISKKNGKANPQNLKDPPAISRPSTIFNGTGYSQLYWLR